MPLRRPIMRLDSQDAKNNPVQIPVALKLMSKDLVTRWQDYVQPIVDSNYVHEPQARAGDHVRADVGWNWNLILAYARAWDIYASFSRSTESIALCIVVNVANFGDFPIGMLTVVPGFESNVLGQTRHRSFAWYLSDAPKEVYTNLLRRCPVRGVAHALVDCCIQAGLEIGEDGSLLLHADPQGGTKLQSFYRDKCGMTQLPAGTPRISRLRFSPSEEYFHFDAEQAKAYSARFDHRR